MLLVEKKIIRERKIDLNQDINKLLQNDLKEMQKKRSDLKKRAQLLRLQNK
ncbi:hypothetical protein [Chengkuizengella sediminis]|uniref:hypothetical protein n=1 Tax=Chengkuizengella sediminis TaxID=1885917 RepID=UPI0013898497|nr:hypothetical protein [Chengkuizengella sediminis]NDI36606.1 hypothetical protein [Chengkuizengella sediminis]